MIRLASRLPKRGSPERLADWPFGAAASARRAARRRALEKGHAEPIFEAFSKPLATDFQAAVDRFIAERKARHNDQPSRGDHAACVEALAICPLEGPGTWTKKIALTRLRTSPAARWICGGRGRYALAFAVCRQVDLEPPPKQPEIGECAMSLHPALADNPRRECLPHSRELGRQRLLPSEPLLLEDSVALPADLANDIADMVML